MFVEKFWHIVEPAMPFIPNWHVDAICDHMEAVRRKEIQYLIFNVPPGCAKSILVSVMYAPWVWLTEPGWRGIFSSYAIGLAERDSIRARDIIQSPEYQIAKYIGRPDATEWDLKGDTNQKAFFENTEKGFRFCTSPTSKGTGYRGNFVACDDPLSAEEAESPAMRLKAIRWWTKTMSSRRNDKKVDPMVVIMQRLHEDDLAGHLLRAGGYEHVCLPSLYESHRKSTTYIRRVKRKRVKAPDGPRLQWVRGEKEKFWEDPRTKDGQLLFPALFDEDVLKETRSPAELGEEGFAQQHQQRPGVEDGGLFKKKYWQWFRWKGDERTSTRPMGCNDNPIVYVDPKDIERKILSVDATFKDGKKSDYVVSTVAGIIGPRKYIMEVHRAKMDFWATLQSIKAILRRHPDLWAKLIEDAANGPAIISTLRREFSGIEAVKPLGGKESRAQAAKPDVACGDVYLLEGDPYVDAWVTEHAAFPNGKHDDQIDTLSQLILYCRGSEGAQRLIAMGAGVR